MDLTVIVWSKPYTISVYQKLKTVWIAVGDYEGHRVEAKGQTKTQVVASWREAARYRSN